jgi:hypothetical protein
MRDSQPCANLCNDLLSHVMSRSERFESHLLRCRKLPIDEEGSNHISFP